VLVTVTELWHGLVLHRLSEWQWLHNHPMHGVRVHVSQVLLLQEAPVVLVRIVETLQNSAQPVLVAAAA
jgi:hypothetical protein